MFGLPKSTEFNKRIPKQKFYDNLVVTPSLKNAIKEQIRVIYWKNKIAPSTMNVAAGKDVTEIEVFEIQTSSASLDESVLRQIDKEIPYHIIFVLHYEEKYQIWIGYKEATVAGANAFKVNNYYHTEWMSEDDISIKVDGLGIDAIYENFIRQIAGETLTHNAGESLHESVVRAEQKEALQKQIDNLRKKIRKEKQLNRQMEMNDELKKLKKEMEEQR